MKLKQRASDFRVRELLRDGVLIGRGEFRVYRVIKRKLTSIEAAEVLADEAGRGAGEVSMCGLKDRQGVTTQFMALDRGPEVRISGPDLRIETVGFAADALTSKDSEGNAFEIVARGLTQDDISALRANLAGVRKQGLINYFDDQRFGNLRHGQGWIARDLMRGETEHALKTMIAAISLHDVPRIKTLKQALLDNWGDWSACREIAGKLGQHHSVFEFLKKNPEDIAGAFFHVSSRLRLIHLYAYQSHVWNRAVADFVREHVQPQARVVLDSEEGPLVYPDDCSKLPVTPDAMFRLPGPCLEDVADPHQRELLTAVLAGERLSPAEFNIERISGFQLKGEDRPLFVKPEHLRVRPPKADPLHRGFAMLGVRFELPRGAYATLVMRRLLEMPGRERKPTPAWESGERAPDDRADTRGGDAPRAFERRGPSREDRGDDRGGFRRDDRGGDRGFAAREDRPRYGSGGPRYGGGAPRDDRGGDRGGFRRDDRGGSRSDAPTPRDGDYPTRQDRPRYGSDGPRYGGGGSRYGGGDRGAPRDDRGGPRYGGGGRDDRGGPRSDVPTSSGGDYPVRQDRPRYGSGGPRYGGGGPRYGGGDRGAPRDDRGGPRYGGGARDDRGGPRFGSGGPRYGDAPRQDRGGQYDDRPAPRYGDGGRGPSDYRDRSGPRYGDGGPRFGDGPRYGGGDRGAPRYDRGGPRYGGGARDDRGGPRYGDRPNDDRSAPRGDGDAPRDERGAFERPQRKRFDPNWRSARQADAPKSDDAPSHSDGGGSDSGVNPASGREGGNERDPQTGDSE